MQKPTFWLSLLQNQQLLYDQCNNKIPKHGSRELLPISLFEAGAKRMESESVRPPKCKMGRSKHQPIGNKFQHTTTYTL